MNKMSKKKLIKDTELNLHYLEENELNKIKDLLNDEQCKFIDTIIFKANNVNDNDEKHMRRCVVASYLAVIKVHPEMCLTTSQDVLNKIQSDEYDFINIVKIIDMNIYLYEKMMSIQAKKKKIENLSHEGHLYLYTLFVLHISIVTFSILNIISDIVKIFNNVAFNKEMQQDFISFIILIIFSSLMIKKYGEAIYVKVTREGNLIDKIKNLMGGF